MGRAYLYVNDFGDREVRDDLLYCCLNNTEYDSQCEDDRSEWLISLVTLTGDEDFCFPKIIDALRPSTDFWNTSQLFSLCAILAKRGNQEAKSAIYEKFDLQEFNEGYLGGYDLIDIDGLTGLGHVAHRLGKRLTEEKDYSDDDALFQHACEKFGQEKVEVYLESVSKTDAYIAKYLKEVKAYAEARAHETEKSKEAYTERIRRKYPLARIISDAENEKGNYPGYYMSFGKHAEQNDICVIFDRLLNEEKRERIIRYLWVFRRRELPRLEDVLFQYAKSDDKELRDAAVSALENCKDERIRELAIDLSRKKSEMAFCAVSLFIENYELGDNVFIEQSLFDSTDEDALHSVCMDLISVFEMHPENELLKSLLWAYENTPCSLCRESIVRKLCENRIIPDELIYECQFDCVEDTRKIAKAYSDAVQNKTP